jgi:hypothetical protein
LTHLTLLSPLGLLVALAAAIPLAALVLAERHAERIARLLRLARAGRRRRAEVVVALVVVALLLGVAAAQPAIGSSQQVRVDQDAQAIFVFDVSESMAAAAGPHAPTRLDRAKQLALRVRAQLGSVQTGAASLTRRVLPYLFPTADEGVFDETVTQSVAVDSPRPGVPTFAQLLEGRRDLATDLTSLASLPTQGFFAKSVTHRLVIVFSDDESTPVSPTSLAGVYQTTPVTHVILVHLGNANERIYRADGTQDPRYLPNPALAAATLRTVAAATRGRVFGEHDLGGIVRVARGYLRGGHVVTQSLKQTHRPLAAWFAAGALVPLLLVLRRRNL